MNFGKLEAVEVFTEQTANTGLDTEDCLVCDCSQIDDAVVQSGVKLDIDKARTFGDVCNRSLSVFD
jgi:hypothetical protein